MCDQEGQHHLMGFFVLLKLLDDHRGMKMSDSIKLTQSGEAKALCNTRSAGYDS
jgi:hypothetical protein